MIKLLRVDDRLIHGQVAVVWTAFLHADTIVVANDKAAGDAFTSMALNLAKPPGVALNIVSIVDAVKFCTDAANEAKKIFVVVESTDDALAIVQGVGSITKCILGGMRKSGDKVLIDRQVFVDSKDIENCKEMVALGCEVTVHIVPQEKVVSLQDTERIYNRAK